MNTERNTELVCRCLWVLLTIMLVSGCGHRGKAEKDEDTAIPMTYVDSVFFTQSLLMRPFIVKMYEERLYEDYGFLRSHCTPELLKKLRNAYPYDSEGEAYAVWLFRSGFQDGVSDEYRIIDVVMKDSETCTYHAIDMGHEFTRTLKFTTEGNRVLMSDVI